MEKMKEEKFTMKDFEKGLMLAGIVKPANEQEEKEKKALDDYEAEEGCKIIPIDSRAEIYKKILNRTMK